MQTPENPRSIDFSTLASRLAGDNAQVAGYVDSLAGRIEHLVSATVAEDWPTVRRLSQHLARTSSEQGYPTLRGRADEVCRAMDRPNNPQAVHRSVLRLIGAYARRRLAAISPGLIARRFQPE